MAGVSLENKTYVFTERIDSVALALKRSRDAVQKIISGVVLVMICLLLVVFGLEVVLGGPTEVFTVDFWQTPRFALAAFWFAMFLVFFLIYRTMEAARHFARLPKIEEEAVVRAEVGDTLEPGTRHNIAEFFDHEAMKTVEGAYETALKFKHADVLPLHLFIGALSTTDAAVVFGRLGINFDTIKDALGRRLASIPAGAETVFGDKAEAVLMQAFLGSLRHRREHVAPAEIMMAAYNAEPFLQELLDSKKVEQQDFENVIAWLRINDTLRRRYKEFSRAAALKPKGAMNRAYTAIATPFLDSVAHDLTRDAAFGRLPLLIGREREVNAIFRAIEGGNQSVVLVGPHGVGKEAIISGIAELMVEERVPNILQDKRLVRVSLPHIVSGASGSEAEARLLRALQEIGMSGNIVTVIEDIDQMIGSGLDLSSVLAQELDRRYTFVIATATPSAYTGSIERSVLGQKLIKVPIDEPEPNEAIRILEAKIGAIEYKQKVIFTYDAIEKIVALTSRYMHERALPEKAIEVAEETALSAFKARGENARVVGEDVAMIITEKTKVPVTELGGQEKETLLHMEERLHERVIGQDEAVKAIAAALRRARTELRSTNRPIANFLFLGPTGVGKTELAKTVSEVYFGREESMLRFDMSEYQEKTSVERLIGGAGEGGLLTEAVRQNPFSLLLLDELEKAHPDILNLFLQVMDDGRLTDGAGRTIDFTNVILIATSNAGAQYLMESVQAGKPLEEIKQHLLDSELKATYRPEFLNRFDGVIVFKPLSIDDVVQIAYLLIAKVAERLKVKGINFQASDAAVYELAQKGFDPKFGARPLRRVIQEEVDNAIANILLKGEVGRRDSLLLEPGGKITVQKAPEL